MSLNDAEVMPISIGRKKPQPYRKETIISEKRGSVVG
jgi:hypothetical protein